MSKFFKVLAVLLFSVCFSVSCDNSRQSSENYVETGNEADDENNEETPEEIVTIGETWDENDGVEEFVTIGEATQSYSDRGEINENIYNENYEEEEEEIEYDDPGDGGSGNDSVVREIAESDIYKLDGGILWLANKHKGLVAVDISNPVKLKILDTLAFSGYTGEMYVQDGRACIFVGNSTLMVVNTEDPSNLSLVGRFDIGHHIIDSRVVGNIVYVVSNEYSSDSEHILIMSIDIRDPRNVKVADKISVEGDGHTVYVSQKSIYVAEANKDDWYEEYTGTYSVTMFDISDPEGRIAEKAVFETEGFMSDRWKMHEIGNTFFAVSSSSQSGSGDSMIESFDVSDPENVRKLDKLVFMHGQRFYGTRFEGDRLYAVTYLKRDPLHVIDISDPAHLRQLGELNVPGWSSHLEVKGTKILAVGRDGEKSKISMYDVKDPEKPKEISTVEIGTNRSSATALSNWKAFNIFDESGLILFPVTDCDDSECIYKLYLVDFDLDKGLKTRGFIESDSYIERGVAVKELVFSIGEEDVVLADATDRDNPKILYQLAIVHNVSMISECNGSLCDIKNLRLVIYDENGSIKWKSGKITRDDYLNGIKMLQNDRFAYIFSGDDFRDEYNAIYAGEEPEKHVPYLKIIKFNEDGSFEDKGNFKFGAHLANDIYSEAVSENNMIATRGMKYIKYSGGYYSEPKFVVYNMNDPKKERRVTEFDFNYKSLNYFERPLFAVGNTFWTGGCQFKQAGDENGDQYLCYALPLDANDPKNPKTGKRINIPGEFHRISGNGRYIYSQTPRIYGKDGFCDNKSYNCNEGWSTYDFYILKLNEDKTAVSVVKKETFTDSFLDYLDDSWVQKDLSHETFIKNDKVFFVKISKESEHGDDSYKEQSIYEVRIVSAADGKEIYKKSFEDANYVTNVNNGGILLSTSDGWTYIAPDGTEKSGEDDISFATFYWHSYRVSEPQLIDGKIYIAAGYDGIYALNLK